MILITSAQCRAARALLNWSQPDLAQKCNIHVQTISNFEQNSSSPTKTTLNKIQQVFENSGIVFTDQGGVNPRVSDIVVYEGKHGFEAFMDDVYETAKKYGGTVYLFNSRPRLWYEWLGEDWYAKHSERMSALGNRIKVKITVQEGDHFLISKFAEHRWFPKRLSKGKIFYGYGPKLGLLDFQGESLKISVFQHKDFADIFRALYDIAWDNVSIEIPKKE